MQGMSAMDDDSLFNDSFSLSGVERSANRVEAAEGDENVNPAAASPSLYSDTDGRGDLDCDEEEVTIAQVMSEMKRAWENEVASPILLPSRHENLDTIVEQVAIIEANVSRPSCRDKPARPIHQLESARCMYVCCDYLRRRVRKIEENPHGALKTHAAWENQQESSDAHKSAKTFLSDRELKFARAYASAESRYFQSSFLGKLPGPLQKVPFEEQPLKHRRCIAKVTAGSTELEDVSITDMGDPTQEIIVSLPEDSIHVIDLKSIIEHLNNDNVMLL